MGKVAFLFPGQGAQYPGMGKELANCSPAAAAVFRQADALRLPLPGHRPAAYRDAHG